MGSPATTARRILKVNHAGEVGAIRIYGAQIAIAKRFFPDIVPALVDMREDEIVHCRLFRDAMPARATRPCRVMSLWSLGGYVLGFTTAVFGRNMVWTCTEAVETAVHRHLGEQLAFLETRDPSLPALIASIQEEELAHLRDAEAHQTHRGLRHASAMRIIGALTNVMIWLSTWGDSSWMRNDMRRAGRAAPSPA